MCLLCFFVCFITLANSQDAKLKTMEQRARELHRVITLNDKEAWIKFMKENYTQALIDKPMRAQIQTSDNGAQTSASSTAKASDNLEAKTGMFKQLHNDFGDSKIVLLKPESDLIEMVLQNGDAMKGIFKLKFETKSPYLIEGFGVEVDQEKN